MVQTPIIWPGGKTSMLPKLLPLMPPHKCAVEVFGGGATFTLAMESETQVYNDRNQNIVRFFLVLREHYNELQSILEYTPYARQEFYNCLPPDVVDGEFDKWEQLWLDSSVDDVEWARRYFVIINLGFTHEEDCTSFRCSKGYSVARALKNHVDRIEQVAQKLRSVVIENLDWTTILKNYDDEDTLFICDPPYISEKGDNATGYRYSFTMRDHYDLIQALDGVRAQVVLCGYPSQLYETFLGEPKWVQHKFTRTAQVGNSSYKDREMRTECCWVKQTQWKLKHSFVNTPLFNLDSDSSMSQAFMKELEES